MNCPKCGAANNGKLAYCVSCGNRLPVEAAPAQPQQPAPQYRPQPQQVDRPVQPVQQPVHPVQQVRSVQPAQPVQPQQNAPVNAAAMVGKLRFWSIFSIFFFVPMAIYGFVKLGAANKAPTDAEKLSIANRALSVIHKWYIPVWILYGLYVLILIIAVIGASM